MLPPSEWKWKYRTDTRRGDNANSQQAPTDPQLDLSLTQRSGNSSLTVSNLALGFKDSLSKLALTSGLLVPIPSDPLDTVLGISQTTGREYEKVSFYFKTCQSSLSDKWHYHSVFIVI